MIRKFEQGKFVCFILLCNRPIKLFKLVTDYGLVFLG